MRRSWFAAVAVMLVGCAGALPPAPTLADAAWAQQRWPDASHAELEQGRALVVDTCGRCHRPPWPSSQPAAAWPDEVSSMVERAGIDPTQRQQIERYLITLASTAGK